MELNLSKRAFECSTTVPQHFDGKELLGFDIKMLVMPSSSRQIPRSAPYVVRLSFLL